VQSVAESYKTNLTICPVCFKNTIAGDEEGFPGSGSEQWGTTHIGCNNCLSFYVTLSFKMSRGTRWYTTGIIINSREMRETLFVKKFHSLVLDTKGKDLAERINATMILL